MNGAEASDELGGLSPDGARALLGFTRALTADRGLAEDIVQDIVLKLLTRTGPPIDNVDAYTRRMAVNAYLSWRRKWSRFEPVGVIEEAGSEPDQTDHHAELADLRQRLHRLPRKQRAVIAMRYFADDTDADIAAALGCSQGAVRSLASRALAALRLDALRLDTEQPTTDERKGSLL